MTSLTRQAGSSGVGQIDRRLPFTWNLVLRLNACAAQSVSEAQLEHAILVRLRHRAIVADASQQWRRPWPAVELGYNGLHEFRLIHREAVPDIFNGARCLPTSLALFRMPRLCPELFGALIEEGAS